MKDNKYLNNVENLLSFEFANQFSIRRVNADKIVGFKDVKIKDLQDVDNVEVDGDKMLLIFKRF